MNNHKDQPITLNGSTLTVLQADNLLESLKDTLYCCDTLAKHIIANKRLTSADRINAQIHALEELIAIYHRRKY